MTQHPWGVSTPEMNAGVIETGSTGATWAAASAAWLGLADATLAAAAITGGQMMASIASISGLRSMAADAATPPFLTWLGTMAGIAFKQAAVCATVAESYGATRTSMIPSMQSINNRVREAAAEASNFFGQNTPLIVALNAEYAAYTVQNASLGTTYGSVITAATLPVPIPPPPPLANAAKAAGDAAAAMGQAGQLVSQASGQGVGQAGQQASSAVTQGSGGANPASAMGQFGSMFSAPMQALQSAGGGMSNPFSSLQQLLSAPMQMFGQAGGLGDLLGGGSTGDAFSPMLTGAGGGLPLGSAGLGAGGGGLGSGGAAVGAGGGGLGGIGGLGTLANKSESVGNVRMAPVLSGVSAPEAVTTRVATAGAGGGMPMSPGAAAGSGAGNSNRDREVILSASPASDYSPPRRSSADKDLFN